MYHLEFCRTSLVREYRAIGLFGITCTFYLSTIAITTLTQAALFIVDWAWRIY